MEGSRQTDRPSQKNRQMVKNRTTKISVQRREDRRSQRQTPRQRQARKREGAVKSQTMLRPAGRMRAPASQTPAVLAPLP